MASKTGARDKHGDRTIMTENTQCGRAVSARDRTEGEVVRPDASASRRGDAACTAVEAVERARLIAAQSAPRADQDPDSAFHLEVRPSRVEGRPGIYYVRRGKRWIKSLRVREGAEEEARARFDLWLMQRRAKALGLVAPDTIPIRVVCEYAIEALRPSAGATSRDRDTYANYKRSLNRLIAHFGDRTLGELDDEAIRDYIESETLDARFTKTRRLISPATKRIDMDVMRRALKKFRGRMVMGWTPEIDLPTVQSGRDRYLTRHELARLLWACRGRIWVPGTGKGKAQREGHWLRDPETGKRVLRPKTEIAKREPIRRTVIGASKAALRIDALLGLGWRMHPNCGCVDVERGIVHRSGYGLGHRQGKPHHSSALTPDLLIHLRGWRRRDLAAGTKSIIHKPLGAERRGAQYRWFPYTVWWEVVADAGLGPDVVPHVLCHTCVTNLIAAGYDPVAVAFLTGRDPLTVVRQYLRWNMDGQFHAVGPGRRPPVKGLDHEPECDKRTTLRARRYEKKGPGRHVSPRAPKAA